MKLVSFFVPGDVQAAVAVVNELNVIFEFTNMMPGIAPRVEPYNPFDDKPGHHVFLKLSDQRVKWLMNNLERRGL